MILPIGSLKESVEVESECHLTDDVTWMYDVIQVTSWTLKCFFSNSSCQN